jgi:hypothetical protein
MGSAIAKFQISNLKIQNVSANQMSPNNLNYAGFRFFASPGGDALSRWVTFVLGAS